MKVCGSVETLPLAFISSRATSRKDGEMRLQMSHSPKSSTLQGRDLSDDLLIFQKPLSNQTALKNSYLGVGTSVGLTKSTQET